MSRIRRSPLLWSCLPGIAFLGLLGASSPAAAAPAPRSWRLELGVRSGYSGPFGDALTGLPLNHVTHGYIPFWLEFGVRLADRWYAGLYGQASVAQVGQPTFGPEPLAGQLISGFRDESLIQLGASAQFHLPPEGIVDTWFGLGIGFEWRTLFDGIEVRPELGLNFRFADFFSLGPFISCAFGRYSFQTKVLGSRRAGLGGTVLEGGVHGWLSFGLRGVFGF